MRKVLISAALIAAAAVSAPAAAQYQGGYGYNNRGTQGVQRQIQQINQQIDSLYQRRLISNREVQSLHNDAQNIQRRLFDYSRNGFTQRENSDIQNRIQNLRQRLQRERREGRDDRRDDRRDNGRRGW